MASHVSFSEVVSVLRVLLGAARPDPGAVFLVLEPEGAVAALNVEQGGQVAVVSPQMASTNLLMLAKGSLNGLCSILDGGLEAAVESGELTVHAKPNFLQQLVSPKTSSMVDIRCAK